MKDRCPDGYHVLPLLERPPVERGACVEIDQVCGACGETVYTISWGRADWERARAKDKRRKAATDGA
jgi:hypothetical protein